MKRIVLTLMFLSIMFISNAFAVQQYDWRTPPHTVPWVGPDSNTYDYIIQY
jgi:hypothetical protein